MADYKGIVPLALSSHRIANHLASAAELDNRMSIAVMWRDALDVDCCPRVNDGIEMTAQPVPIDLAVLIIDVTLIPDPDRLHLSSSLRRTQWRLTVSSASRRKLCSHLKRRELLSRVRLQNMLQT